MFVAIEIANDCVRFGLFKKLWYMKGNLTENNSDF